MVKTHSHKTNNTHQIKKIIEPIAFFEYEKEFIEKIKEFKSKLCNKYFGETKTHYKLYKSGKNWVVMGISVFFLGGMLVTSRPVSADSVATSISSSTVGAETTNASSSSDTKSASQSEATAVISSSAVKTDSTSASSSAVKTDSPSAISSSASDTKTGSTSASSSSTVNADSPSASSSSTVNADSTGASSGSAVNADSPSASSSSTVNADSPSASSSSAVNADSTGASSGSAVNADSPSASSSSTVEAKTTSASSSSAMKADVTSAGSVTTNTGFSVSDPDYPSGMWIDPDKSHYSYEWLQAQYGGNQVVLSTNRTGDGIVYVTELSPSNKVLKQYTLNQNTQVRSAIVNSTTYYNDTYYAMVESLNPLAVKYIASKYDTGYYNSLSYMVPKLITQTTHFVDKDGKQIIDSNGNPVAAYTQKGLVGQKYTTSPILINGYYATASSNSNGVMSPYGEIGASYVKNFHNGIVVTYTQTGSDGTMSASIAQNGKVQKTYTNIKPSDPAIFESVGSTRVAIKNPYIPQTSDVEYVYRKLGNWVVSNPDGSTTSRIYPNDPSNPTKIADSSVPGYPVIDFLPGYTPKDHMGTPLVPVDPDDRTKGYIPPIPSDIGQDTTITYTADQQTGSVSYVDDTTGKTLKTDPISGTTGSKSSYSTSGSIADYKKQGYELFTDGYPADLTFDNDDTTAQNFTVHLKHQLTPVNPTAPQTPGTPINPDEPDGPKWPSSTNYDKTVKETISYFDKNGHVVGNQHTDSVNFTRTVVVDNVTGEVITSGAGTTAWTATNGDTTFDAVVSPVIKGYTPDRAEIGSQTVSGDSSDLDFTVIYTKDVPTKPVNPSQPTTLAKPVQAGQATATNFVDQRLPQTGETDQQHMMLSGLLLLAMSSVLGLFGMTKRQRKE
ncbi:Levansucrase [Streptococcus infantarius subsp. infantarius]|nr:Levansucrase [Streptococcus infantarius subsp. infantarius]